MKRLTIMFAAALSCGIANMSNTMATTPKKVPSAATAINDSIANAPQLTFTTTSHDFGTFQEEKGKVTCTFGFKNTGKSPLVLQKVRASCGCTTPNWTKTPVAAGDTGFVTATYNASGRPGAFTKTITVTSNAGADQRLTIRGEVIPRVKKVEEEYPFEIKDEVRIKNRNVYLRAIDYPNTKSERIQIVNNSGNPVDISFANVPKYLTVKMNNTKLTPKQKADIEVTFNSKDANDWGEVHATFDILVNGKSGGNDKKVNINATVRENFANMTPEQKSNAPVLKVDNTVELGTIAAGTKKKTYKFSVTNDGKDLLYIRKAKSNNDNVKVEYPAKPIKPGKKGDIKVTVSTENQKPGKFNYRVTIICNDPTRSTTGVQLSGEVK